MSNIGFERPGGLTITSTAGSADMVSLLGGTSLYGVTFTKTELRNVSDFYGVDPEQSKALADAGHAEALEAAAVAMAKPKRYSWESSTSVKVPTEKDRKAVETFLDAGTNLATLRQATIEGLRLMAYLSHFLQAGEDPVALVHNMCRDAGYDTTRTGFREPDEGDEEY